MFLVHAQSHVVILGVALVDNGGDYARAKAVLEECLAIVRGPIENRPPYAYAVAHLGRLALYRGDFQAAAQMLEESLSLAQSAHVKSGAAYALLYLGQLSLHGGDLARARRQLGESLSLSHERHEQPSIAKALVAVAALARALGQTERAVLLLGGIDAFCKANGTRLPPVYRVERDRIEGAVRAEMDQAKFQSAWAEGCAKTPEQIVDDALEFASSVTG